MSSLIHSTAIVSTSAVIGEGCEVGPYSIIGPKVTLGKNNKIAAHVVIEGHTKIGENNEIFQFASIGAKPQDLKYKGEDSILEIGDSNIIREYVTLQPGTIGGGMLTRIGNSNLFMANVHVGHDSIIGSGNIFANSAGVAGHVIIGDKITVGGLSGIHQFVRVGDYALIGGGAMLVQDLPPYCIAQGDRAKLVGLNRIGLSRHGFSSEDMSALKVIYRNLFLATEGTFKVRLENILSTSTGTPAIRNFLDFISSSKRGLCLPRRGRVNSEDSD